MAPQSPLAPPPPFIGTQSTVSLPNPPLPPALQAIRLPVVGQPMGCALMLYRGIVVWAPAPFIRSFCHG